ncbi:MAG: hypothetical protein H7203_13870 [Rhizobacter sp.]|nr:hypothetical protein [Burkholderiales bacterium]
MKTISFSVPLSASLCALALLAAFSTNHVAAQTPVRNDKIMTIAELRACMKLEKSNNQNAAEILQTQQAFKRDQDAINVEQAEVSKANDEIRARSATIISERDALALAISAASTSAQAAKTDEDKAQSEVLRLQLVERNRLLDQKIDSFTTLQQTQRDRITALNARIDPINQRNKTINERVAPHQTQIATWRDQCGNRRFREEEEVLIKKEMAAGQ